MFAYPEFIREVGAATITAMVQKLRDIGIPVRVAIFEILGKSRSFKPLAFYFLAEVDALALVGPNFKIYFPQVLDGIALRNPALLRSEELAADEPPGIIKDRTEIDANAAQICAALLDRLRSQRP